MKYTKVIDLWENDNADKLRTGEIRLQSGQWVKCGPGPLSVYHSVRGASIYCFHGETPTAAFNKYKQFVEHEKHIASLRYNF